MTGGFAALPMEDDREEEVRWSGVSRIVGPRWVQLPVLTVGLLGVQVLWSVEMSQGASYSYRFDRRYCETDERIYLFW